MTISINIFWVVLLLVIIKIATEHLFNRWFREVSDDGGFLTVVVLYYLAKWAIFLTILYELCQHLK